jgi:hypothetical protein
MRKKKEVVLVDYLIAAFAGQVVLDEFGDFRPRGW